MMFHRNEERPYRAGSVRNDASVIARPCTGQRHPPGFALRFHRTYEFAERLAVLEEVERRQ
jgi:hypothetical protein